MRLSIVMPVYNEERTLPAVIDRVHASCGDFSQVIFVDDGSTDGSLAILRARARPQDLVLSKPNGGKGSAVRAGYAKALGTYTIVQDADLEYSPEEIPTMLVLAEQKNLPAVFGSRRIKDQKQYVHIKYYLGGILLTGIFNLLYGTRITDQPNCYKMVRTDILRALPLTEDDFGFDAELTALLARRGIAIAEVPTSYHPRSVAEGKKIGAKDWFRAIGIFLRLRFASRKTV